MLTEAWNYRRIPYVSKYRRAMANGGWLSGSKFIGKGEGLWCILERRGKYQGIILDSVNSEKGRGNPG